MQIYNHNNINILATLNNNLLSEPSTFEVVTKGHGKIVKQKCDNIVMQCKKRTAQTDPNIVKPVRSVRLWATWVFIYFFFFFWPYV